MRDWRSVLRFALVGTLNTAVYYVIYVPALLVLPYLPAHVLAWLVAFVGSFFANCHFTYRVLPTWGRFFRYPLVAVAQLAASSVGVALLVEGVHADERVAPLIAGVLIIPITYAMASYALKKPRKGVAEGADRSSV